MLGEYPAFITVWAFVVDAILAGGAVARSWSSYLAQLVCQLSLQACRIVDSPADLPVARGKQHEGIKPSRMAVLV